ncbi:MAG: glycosyltransferase family 4 protein [Flavobacteriaceae bacterium]
MAKRVLIFTNHFYPEQFKINEVVSWLIADGFKLHVVTGWPNYPEGKIYKGYGPFKKSFEKRGNLTIRRLPLFPRGSGSNSRLILNYLTYFVSTLIYTFHLIIFHKKYEKVLVHHTSPFFISISAILYKIFRKSSAILWDLDLWPQTLEAVGIIKSRSILNGIEKTVKIIYKNFDIILVGSNSFKNIVQNRVYHNRIYYFPNWAEKIIEENKIVLKTDIKLNKNALKIIFMGNIGTVQGLDILCKVINQINEKNIQWIFIGDGRFKGKMMRLLSEEIIKRTVVFVPQQNLKLIPYWGSKADFFYISLNNSELFNQTVPAKLQGYMAMGKPILGMIGGEGALVLKKSNSGLVCDPGNINQLMKIVEKAINTNKKERYILGENGRKFYNKNFSSDLRRKQLLKLFE